ncbi:Uncharacterised protein [Mycobacterium tuberculosis]|uniref:Uncharacterized protein n=1 Tax=Mycobacterium tuberculosis TaxID=1773 RepID=A0A654TUH9_MYCTX|nr:Uncharacterised protein [Mycobacterium tuberculosis]
MAPSTIPGSSRRPTLARSPTVTGAISSWTPNKNCARKPSTKMGIAIMTSPVTSTAESKIPP